MRARLAGARIPAGRRQRGEPRCASARRRASPIWPAAPTSLRLFPPGGWGAPGQAEAAGAAEAPLNFPRSLQLPSILLLPSGDRVASCPALSRKGPQPCPGRRRPSARRCAYAQGTTIGHKLLRLPVCQPGRLGDLPPLARAGLPCDGTAARGAFERDFSLPPTPVLPTVAVCKRELINTPGLLMSFPGSRCPRR